MTEQISYIPARLKNAAVNGHVAGAEDIIDDVLNRTQNDINEEVAAVPYNVSNPNGMGKVVLKKNDNFKQVVEAQTNGNTIFVIKYDFTLTSNVTVPANCVLEFDGGSVSGEHTITGNSTGIQAGLIKIFNTNLTFTGTWNITEVYPEWFGAAGDGVTDDTIAINKCFNIPSGGNIKLAAKKYLISNTITFNRGYSLIGKYSFDTYSSNFNNRGTIILITHTTSEATLLDNGCSISNIMFVYPNQDGNTIIEYPATIKIKSESSKCDIRQICLYNSYIGIDASEPHSMLTISDVRGFVLNRGVIIDNDYDIDRIDNVHFNYANLTPGGLNIGPGQIGNLRTYAYNNGIFIDLKRGDWIEFTNCFCYGYSFGVNINGRDGITDNIKQVMGTFTNCGFDGMRSCINIVYADKIVFNCCKFVSFSAYENVSCIDYAIIIGNFTKNIIFTNCVAWGIERGFCNGATDKSEATFIGCNIDIRQYSSTYWGFITNGGKLWLYNNNVKNCSCVANGGSIICKNNVNTNSNLVDTENSGSVRPSNVNIGYQFFDTNLNPQRPIWYIGSNNWVDATGATV